MDKSGKNRAPCAVERGRGPCWRASERSSRRAAQRNVPASNAFFPSASRCLRRSFCGRGLPGFWRDGASEREPSAAICRSIWAELAVLPGRPPLPPCAQDLLKTTSLPTATFSEASWEAASSARRSEISTLARARAISLSRKFLPYVLQNLGSAGRDEASPGVKSRLSGASRSAAVCEDRARHRAVPSLQDGIIVSLRLSISRGVGSRLYCGKAELNYLPCMKGDKAGRRGGHYLCPWPPERSVKAVGGNYEKKRSRITASKFHDSYE